MKLVAPNSGVMTGAGHDAPVTEHRGTVRRGFTLLELLVTLAVIALASAVVVAAFGGIGVGARQRAALDGVVAGLSRARLSALQSQARVEARLALAQVEGKSAVLSLSGGPWERSWAGTGLVPTAGVGEDVGVAGGVRKSAMGALGGADETANLGVGAALSVVFDAGGRADRALWRLAEDGRGSASAGAGSASGGASVGGPVGRTLWVVRFDVVSGVPTAERVKQP